MSERKAKEEVMAVVKEEEEGQKDTVRLSTGVILKAKSIPPELVHRLRIKFSPPEIPRIHLEDQNRWEENPSDPNYLSEVARVEGEFNKAFTILALLRGTEVVNDGGVSIGEIPQDLQEDLEFLGIAEEPKSRQEIYLNWLEAYAIGSQRDVTKLLLAIFRKTGVSEEDVAVAAASFPSREGRSSDNGVSAT